MGIVRKMALAEKELIYGNMSEFPFQLSITCEHPEKRTELIECTALLRHVPGRRKVFDALWNERNIIVKVFTHKLRARRHLKREWRGLTTLSKSKINTPEPLFFGQTEKGYWAVAVEKISDSSTALEIFNNFDESQKKIELLIMICRELARQHRAGILQKDFHLENFIIANGRIYTLDPGQMQFYKPQVPRRKSISNLALLLLCLNHEDSKSQKMLCREYFQARDLRLLPSDEKLIQKEIELQRKRGIKHGLKKSLRTSKRFLRIETSRFSGVFSKAFCTKSEALDFISTIDDLMAKGRILKNGNTCFVSRLTWNKKDIVIKRYNHKSFTHSFQHTIIKSRARRNWIYAQRLTMLHIPTPKPLAFIERRKGFLVWNSYYVTEYIEGKSLHNILSDPDIPVNQHAAAKTQVEILLDRIGKFHITHGDLKHTNILITENGPVLTDLDAMKAHKSKLLYKRRRAKDIERFHRLD